MTEQEFNESLIANMHKELKKSKKKTSTKEVEKK